MIFPVPQKMKLEGRQISDIERCFSVSGDSKSYAAEKLASLGFSCSDNAPVSLFLKREDSRAFCYAELPRRICDEIYRIDVSALPCAKIKITFSSERGLFRALHTLAKLVDSSELKEGSVQDYPLFQKRGYIEGFYGKPWSFAERADFMSLMAKNGMNTFYYAPKDDAYHRDLWREMYPEKELCELKSLIGEARANEIDFHYCIAPGLSMCYSDEKDFETLVKKIESVAALGVAGVGLLLDDIPDTLNFERDKSCFSDTVNAHIFLINALYERLKNDMPGLDMTVCPMLYHGEGDEYYIAKLGRNIPAEVEIFWTGRDICSQRLTTQEAAVFARAAGHRPLYWDNYPVNDAEMLNEMHLGPIIGRDAQLYRFCDGLISNVMEYCECSKIPMLTVADYLWNPEKYSHEASRKNALKAILGDRAELFGFFADNLNWSCLTKENSVLMEEKLMSTGILFLNGDTDGALALLNEYIDNMNSCREMIFGGGSCLFDELRVWINKFGDCCRILELCRDMIAHPSQETAVQLKKCSQTYHSNATWLTGFCLRDFAQRCMQIKTD